jgi:hypothetical protein
VMGVSLGAILTTDTSTGRAGSFVSSLPHPVSPKSVWTVKRSTDDPDDQRAQQVDK